MRSATSKAVAFALALGLAATTAAASPEAPPGSAAPGPSTSDRRAPGGEDREEAADPSYQTISTLGALALGVLGLLWMRRKGAPS